MPSRARAGFTLAELMVVVAIIGLGSYVVSMSFDAIVPRERLNTSVRNLTSTLRDARSRAISKGLPFEIEYDLPGRRYRLVTPFRNNAEGLFIEGADRDEDRFVTAWQFLADGVDFAELYVAGVPYNGEDPYRVRFDGRGSATEHSVVLAQPQYESFTTVEVMALTGLFRMHDGRYVREPVEEGDFD